MRQQTRTYHDWPSTWALVARYVIKVDLAKSQKKRLNLPYSSRARLVLRHYSRLWTAPVAVLPHLLLVHTCTYPLLLTDTVTLIRR